MAEWSRAETDDGQTFVFADEGEGPLVVLIHGFPDTPHGYERIAAALVEAGYRVVRPWLRGYHPDTIVPGRPYDLVTISSDPIRLLDALGERDAVIAGHDWGSGMVYGAAAMYPERVRGAVPIALPNPNFLPRSPLTLIAARHMLALNLPWAERGVKRNDFAYVDRLYRRWAPRWNGPEPERCIAHAKEAFRDDRVLAGALDYYRALGFRSFPEFERPSPGAGSDRRRPRDREGDVRAQRGDPGRGLGDPLARGNGALAAPRAGGRVHRRAGRVPAGAGPDL